MKKPNIFLFLCRAFIFALIIPEAAVAQLLPLGGTGVDGGGGKSIVCRNSAGQIQKIEVLDLFEGRIQYGLSYRESVQPKEDQIIQIMKNSGLALLNQGMGKTIQDGLDILKAHMILIPADAKLLPTDDSYEAVVPVGCAVEQSVNFQNEHSILVDTNHWTAMSETQKAALMMHEAIYRQMRIWGESDSRRARHFNAFLFNGGKFVGSAYEHGDICDGTSHDGKYTQIIAYLIPATEASAAKVGFDFFELNGRIPLSRIFLENYNQHSEKNINAAEWLQQMVKPSQYFFAGGVTQSDFEAGDQIFISSYRAGDSGPYKMRLQAQSSLDDTQYTIDLNCRAF